jgi:ABC-type molybdate transport system substrate-binding protein
VGLDNKADGLVCLAEEISRQHNIQALASVLLAGVIYGVMKVSTKTLKETPGGQCVGDSISYKQPLTRWCQDFKSKTKNSVETPES